MATITLLTAATATNSEPTAATDGVSIANKVHGDAALCVWNTAGTGTVTATIRLWGYVEEIGEWFPLGSGTDTGKGIINDGAALGENGVADVINHSEVLSVALQFDRLYAEVTAIGGTATAVSVSIVNRRRKYN